MSQSNAAEIADWNDSRGRAWLARHEQVNAQITPFGRRAMARLALAGGERVIDIGCGCGEPTIELARTVGPTGHVTGIDGSRLLLEEARATARRDGLTNVDFVEGDAEVYAFAPGGADAAFSRFGVMFFTGPEAAFGNIRSALRPGGRLAFVCWRTPGENRFITLPLAVAQRFSGGAGPRTDPEAPGPFAFADAGRVRRILSSAGFADIAIEPADEKIGGASLDDTIAFCMNTQAIQQLLQQGGAAARGAMEAAFREALQPFVTPGGVFLDAAAWIVSARNP